MPAACSAVMTFKVTDDGGSGGSKSFSLSQGGEGENRKEWPCVKCMNHVDNGIECELCEEWVHYACADVSKTNAGKIKNCANFTFLCAVCAELFNSVKIGLQSIRKSKNDVKKIVCAANEFMIEVACNDDVSVGQMKKNSYADALKTDIEQMKKDMVDMKNKMIEKVTTVEDVMLDTRERDRRKTNLILHQVEEIDDDAKRKEHDTDTVNKLLTELGFNSTKILRCFRLGPKRTDGKHRLMLVDVGSQDVRDSILRRAPNLKKSAQFAKIFISEDRTPAEQESMRKLVREKNEMAKNDASHIYLIRQFRIVKIKKREDADNQDKGKSTEEAEVAEGPSGASATDARSDKRKSDPEPNATKEKN